MINTTIYFFAPKYSSSSIFFDDISFTDIYLLRSGKREPAGKYLEKSIGGAAWFLTLGAAAAIIYVSYRIHSINLRKKSHLNWSQAAADERTHHIKQAFPAGANGINRIVLGIAT